MYQKVLLVSITTLALGVAGIPTAAGHGGGAQRTHVIEAQDDCDVSTFNLAVGAGTCVGNGETTFPDFIAELVDEGAADDWNFDPDELKIRSGDTLEVRGEGGEFHTFTRVEEFGGGCVPELNAILKLSPVAECKDLVTLPDGSKIPRGFAEDGVPPGSELSVSGLSVGSQKFECLIHPWMHAEVKVRAAHR